MSVFSDMRVLYHLAVKPVAGKDHAARMESFYGGQAGAYDDFRRRLLAGREELYASLPVPEGGVWVDMGGGTGSNLTALGDRLSCLAKAYVVDLSPSLLEVARQRAIDRNWTNVEAVEADATQFRPAEGTADVVTFSYSLTMIPDWFAAVDNALAMLAPGGIIGVVDFFVGRNFASGGTPAHSWFTRSFWPVWFATDNVFLSSDHIPFLERRFSTTSLFTGRAKIPYLPLVRVPYYRFVGTKPAA